VVQSFRDESLTTCPACGGDLRKVFGTIGIAFKGSGFYKTDSRNTSAPGSKKGSEVASTSSESSSSSSPSGSGSSSSDSGSKAAAS
jgi:predicted nucleic acid-binding Zn ribbon protein